MIQAALDRIKATLDVIWTMLSLMEATLDVICTVLDRMEATLDVIRAVLDVIGARFDVTPGARDTRVRNSRLNFVGFGVFFSNLRHPNRITALQSFRASQEPATPFTDQTNP